MHEQQVVRIGYSRHSGWKLLDRESWNICFHRDKFLRCGLSALEVTWRGQYSPFSSKVNRDRING